MTESEMHWRQMYRMQLDIAKGLAASLMASSEKNTKVYVMSYHVKEKMNTLIEVHDELYPYDSTEMLK